MNTNELQILLSLYGYKRLPDEIEKELFKNEILLRMYITHLIINSNCSSNTIRNALRYPTLNIVTYYARQVLKARWYVAEEHICKHDNLWIIYKNEFKM